MPTWKQRKRVIDATLTSLARSLPSQALPKELLHLTLFEVERLAGQGQDVAPALLRLQRAVLSMDDFVVASTLSRSGSFASVQLVTAQKHLSSLASGLATNEHGSQKIYVVKALDRSWGFRMQNQQFISNELNILQQSLKTPPDRRHTPALIASFLSSERFHLVISHCSGGDLWTLLEATNANVAANQRPDDSLVKVVGLEEGLVRGWMKELLEALEWLNSEGWAHRDVKPQNLLLNEHGRLLLTDFGSAAPIQESPSKSSTSHRPTSIAKKYCRALVGTPDYIAPEVLKYAEGLVEQNVDESYDGGEPTADDGDERAYGAEVDLWSFAVVIYELLTGQAPFFAESIAETYDRIINSATTLSLPLPTPVTPAATSLISSLLVPASARPSLTSLKSHLFFKPLPSTSTYVPPSFEMPTSTCTPSSPYTLKNCGNDDDSPQLFNFNSAFFSSPGLSILRPSPKTSQRSREQEEQYWKGIFTWMPEEGEFDRALAATTSESKQETRTHLAASHSTPLHPSASRHRQIENLMTGTPISRLIGAQTPLPNHRRSSSTPIEEGDLDQAQKGRGSSGRAKRNVSDLEAWKEMQERAWVVGMTVRKASAAKGVDRRIASPSDRLSKTSEARQKADESGMDEVVDELRKRHANVMRGLDGLEKKYESLFKLAAAEKA